MKQTEILTHATHVNGWEPAVYMSCMSQNFRLFHISNLSVRNFRIFLLMYPGSLARWAAKSVPSERRLLRWLGQVVMAALRCSISKPIKCRRNLCLCSARTWFESETLGRLIEYIFGCLVYCLKYQQGALIGDERVTAKAPSCERDVHVRKCRCDPHLTCVRRIEWVPSHAPNLSIIRPVVCKIWKRDVHVRTCRCIPSLICVELLSDGSLSTQKI